MPDIGVIFEAAPALKYTEDVVLHGLIVSTIEVTSEAFMSNFTTIKALCLHVTVLSFVSQLDVPSPGILTRTSTHQSARISLD